jgi:hypothetical protein
VDIVVQLTYDPKAKLGEDTVIRSNATKSATEDILMDYLRTQIGKGKDDRKVTKQPIYHITIGVDLADDSFHVQDDTGNAGLTTGIVMDAAQRLQDNKLAVLPLLTDV